MLFHYKTSLDKVHEIILVIYIAILKSFTVPKAMSIILHTITILRSKIVVFKRACKNLKAMPHP